LGPAWRHARILAGLDAARHLFRVAAGLESAVLGENEILGQVARAYEEARSRGLARRYLSMLFQFAIRVGKLVRSRTGISRGNIGYPGAAVKLAWEALGPSASRIVVLGAGEAASVMASLARERWPRAYMVIVNRSRERAEALASRLGAEAAGLGELPRALRGADLLLAAVAAHDGPVVRAEQLSLMRPGGLVVDISVPPAVERPRGRGVRYAGPEEVREAVRETIERRRAEVPKAEAIIEEELAVLRAKWARRLADDAVARIMRYAEAVAAEEAGELLSVLRGRGVDGVAEEPVALFARSMAKKLLRPLILYAQEAARRGRLSELEELASMFERELAKKEEARPRSRGGN
jgi:glutamyl-tRNA reductase